MDFAPDPEALAIAAAVRRFARDALAPRAQEADEAGVFDRSWVPRLGAEGLLGGPLPREYGGRAWSAVAWVLAQEELGAVDSSWRGFCTVQVGLCGMLLAGAADAAQRARLLPALTRGDAIFAYALTEPEAGTDVASLATVARPDGSDFVLEGTKHWITNGGVADWILLFATVDRSLGKRGITCFLVPGDAPGLRRDRMPGEHFGHRASDHARLTLDGVRVPAADVVGTPGEGFALAMKGLAFGRLSVAAGAVGIQMAAEEACLDFARRRRQFGQRIGDFQLIQELLADLHVARRSSHWLVLEAAWRRDQGLPFDREVSVAKYAASEAAVRAADQAILLHGARGYSSTSPVGRLYRDAKGLQIYEGTSHIQRLLIARDLLGREERPSPT